MPSIKKIIKGDIVKLISGANKGTTGKVVKVLNKEQAVLVEGLGLKHRHFKPTQLNPRATHKDIHVPVPIHKVALVVDEKSSKTSRVGRVKKVDGGFARIARQSNNKEIK
jgi:large subunit ribosomal protein L24